MSLHLRKAKPTPEARIPRQKTPMFDKQTLVTGNVSRPVSWRG
jgi:hypothetical protein